MRALLTRAIAAIEAREEEVRGRRVASIFWREVWTQAFCIRALLPHGDPK